MMIEAPAKLNLCLYLGPRRPDGLHRLCSLFEPITLADVIEVHESDEDSVECPGVDEPNLAAAALRGLRERGWSGPPLSVRIKKRIPVAAGLGGGSADAAAILRLGAEEVGDLDELAAEIGADVPSQIKPALALVEGAGEKVRRLPDPRAHAFCLLPGGGGLATRDVFAEADRQGLGREASELDDLAERLAEAAGSGAGPLDYAELLVNDLEPAAAALRPEIHEALDALRDAGATTALISGSGPTAFGIFENRAGAESAAARTGRPDAIICESGVPA